MPDNRGIIRAAVPIDEAAPATRDTLLPLDAIEQALVALGESPQHSRDPGRYICNNVMFADLGDAGTRAGFIHLPYTTSFDDAARARFGNIVAAAVTGDGRSEVVAGADRHHAAGLLLRRGDRDVGRRLHRVRDRHRLRRRVLLVLALADAEAAQLGLERELAPATLDADRRARPSGAARPASPVGRVVTASPRCAPMPAPSHQFHLLCRGEPIAEAERARSRRRGRPRAVVELLAAAADRELELEVTRRAIAQRELADAELGLVVGRVASARRRQRADRQADRQRCAITGDRRRAYGARRVLGPPGRVGRHRCRHPAPARRRWLRASTRREDSSRCFMAAMIFHAPCHAKPAKSHDAIVARTDTRTVIVGGSYTTMCAWQVGPSPSATFTVISRPCSALFERLPTVDRRRHRRLPRRLRRPRPRLRGSRRLGPRARGRRRPAKVVALRGNHEDAWLQVVDEGWPEFVLPRGNGCLECYRSFTGLPIPDEDDAADARRDATAMFDGAVLPARRDRVDARAAVLLRGRARDLRARRHQARRTTASRIRRRSSRQRALLWLRDRDFFENYRGKLVVFGHTTTRTLPNELSTYTPDDPTDLWAGPACVGLDTACGKGGFLTAFELPAQRVYESRG